MKLRVALEYDREIQSYAVYRPELPGCASEGGVEIEAFENITEAIQLYFEPSSVELGSDDKLVELDVAIQRPGAITLRGRHPSSNLLPGFIPAPPAIIRRANQHISADRRLS